MGLVSLLKLVVLEIVHLGKGCLVYTRRDFINLSGVHLGKSDPHKYFTLKEFYMNSRLNAVFACV